MIYNLVLCSMYHREFEADQGLDGRPLRFTDKAYAEREAHERNIRLLTEEGPDCFFYWKVKEENND